ncbi:hypothetical protein, partial [Paraburkholderia phenoliruptrix]|uniref:hypothetical protein n=1 Tax=Paraburkholderia phenoliruptrix TaxID=252970 RepID=UPI0015906854
QASCGGSPWFPVREVGPGNPILSDSTGEPPPSTFNYAWDIAATGQWAVEYQGALNAYYSTNGQAIMAGQSVAGVASPYQPAVAELVNLGYLPSGFSSKAPNGQTFTSSVSQVSVGGTPSLAGYVYSTTPYKDGTGAVRNDLAGLAMQAAGADAGMSTPGHAGQLIGTGNGWQTSIAGIPVGTFAMRVGSYADMDAMLSQFYMLNGSRPLTGPMNANNNSMSNVSTFGATGNITTSGGTFRATNAPGGIGVQIANAQIYGDGSNIAMRAPNAAYIQTTAGGWAALNAGDVNSNGNASIAGSAAIYGNATVNGTTTLNGTTVQNGTHYQYGSSVINGYMYMNGGGSIQTQLPLAATAYAGWGCSGNGITTDPSGNILACQSGVWQQGGGFTHWYNLGAFQNTHSSYVPLGWYKFCYTFGVNGPNNNSGIVPLGQNGVEWYWGVENNSPDSSGIQVACMD